MNTDSYEDSTYAIAAQNSDLFVGGSSDFVYRDQLKRLEGILKVDRTKISKDPFWIEKS